MSFSTVLWSTARSPACWAPATPGWSSASDRCSVALVWAVRVVDRVAGACRRLRLHWRRKRRHAPATLSTTRTAHTSATEHRSDAEDHPGVAGAQHAGDRAVDQSTVEEDIDVEQAVPQDRDPG